MQGVSPAGLALLSLAARLARDGERSPALPAFLDRYRDWIAAHRGRLGTQREQAEQWQLLMQAMINAETLEAAVLLLIRFGRVVWGDRGPMSLRTEDGIAAIGFSEPPRDGPEGLLGALWPLALTLCELQFLCGHPIEGASGLVPQPPCLPPEIVALLFAAPVRFGAGELALLLPHAVLRRPVLARAAALPAFFSQLLPLTLRIGRPTAGLAPIVRGLLHDDARGPCFSPGTLDGIAARLGMGATTLRRRLAAEGTGFRRIREEVQAGLARTWLAQAELPLGEIAARLGFSDGFAFRRFFRRVTGEAPSAYRRGHAPPAPRSR